SGAWSRRRHPSSFFCSLISSVILCSIHPFCLKYISSCTTRNDSVFRMGRDETRVYVGNLPPDCREKDLEDIFAKYGKVRFIDIKGGRGPAFAFVEFDDARDAEDAVRGRDGYDFDGSRIRNHFKDHMREAGEVCYADVSRDGTGTVEFVRLDDMKYALKKLDDTKIPERQGTFAYSPSFTFAEVARRQDLQDQSLAAHPVIENVEEHRDVNGIFFSYIKVILHCEKGMRKGGNDKRWSKAHTAAYEIGLIQWNQLRNHGQMGRDETRIYVGNLPPDCREKDIEDIFAKYGKIRFVDIKGGRGPLFAFVEFEDSRDAEDAVRGRDGYDFDGSRIRVEFTRGAGPRGPGLPATGSWQDLKDHMREAGEVCYADVARDGTGTVEFTRLDDMKYALKKLDDTKERQATFVCVKTPVAAAAAEEEEVAVARDHAVLAAEIRRSIAHVALARRVARLRDPRHAHDLAVPLVTNTQVLTSVVDQQCVNGIFQVLRSEWDATKQESTSAICLQIVVREILKIFFRNMEKIRFVDIKGGRGPLYAFIDFEDPRGRGGYGGYGGDFGSSRGRGGPPNRRSNHRVIVEGLPPTGSWQDLKDHIMRGPERFATPMWHVMEPVLWNLFVLTT
ncbi:hypothetical protein OSTOST_20096, partial [Ostertagia ostertagi]